MKMVPSAAKAVARSVSAYRGLRQAAAVTLESYAPKLLHKPSLTVFKEFRAVNLPKDER